MSKFRVQKSVSTIAVPASAQATFSALTVPLNGVLWQHKVKIVSNSDAAATMTLNIIDADGDVVYTKATISGSAGTVVGTVLTGDTRVPLNGLYTVQIVFSANQTTTANTVTVTLLIDRG